MCVRALATGASTTCCVRNFSDVNHQRVYRFYRQANLAVRHRKKVSTSSVRWTAQRCYSVTRRPCVLTTARRSPAAHSMAWAQAHGIRHILIQPGCPVQNGYIESFNGKFRDEHLNESWFETLYQARAVLANWRQDYNEVRLHSSLGRIPPARFAELRRQYASGAARSQSTQTTIE